MLPGLQGKSVTPRKYAQETTYKSIICVAAHPLPDIAELFKVGVPAVIIPLAVFGANWAYRHHSEYNQTAASDFILAVLVFDGTVVSATKEFEPFIQHPVLRLMAANWHIFIAVLGAFLWWMIVTFAEPVIAAHYSTKRNRPPFPFWTLLICWVGVFILISVHVSFFVLRVGDAYD